MLKVVNNTIAKDLEDINAKVKESSKELRSERIRLIKVVTRKQDNIKLNI